VSVKAVFVELPPFEHHRANYLDDSAFLRLQRLLMVNPEAGALIPGTGGLRKLRFADERRGKGKRGGLRVIYYWWNATEADPQAGSGILFLFGGSNNDCRYRVQIDERI